jgi:glutathione S-transferase
MTTSLPELAHLYHLAIADEWNEAVHRGGPYTRSTAHKSLDEEGYIHCSMEAQLQDTADRHYRGRGDVVLLTIDPSLLESEIRIEDLHGMAESFPHVYGPIPIAAVIAAHPVPLTEDGRLDISAALATA